MTDDRQHSDDRNEIDEEIVDRLAKAVSDMVSAMADDVEHMPELEDDDDTGD